MRLPYFVGLGLVLAVASTSAFAFQEQQSGGGAPPPSSAAPVAPEAAPPAPGSSAGAPDIGYSSSTAGGAGASAGTEVRIPGIGKPGVLPKMDFGLELLYGASESKQPAPEQESPADDLTVRGTIKHNF